jgi:hypothetical protein
MRRRRQQGQAILLVTVASGLFLIGALGLVMDGAQIYAHRQMAQDAADAAAQAGMMSIFNANATGGLPSWAGGSFTCTTTDASTPCVYARHNGFGGTAADTVNIDFPTSAAGVNLWSADPVNVIRATVTRTLNTGLMRLLGSSTSTVKAISVAAIVDVTGPAPILVLHPSNSNSLSGGGTVTVCGGPGRSIQVNSTSATAVNASGSMDLSNAGPKDSSSLCIGGTGADFGAFGGPSSFPGSLSLGTTGHYIQPASPILDPLISVPTPAKPLNAGSKSPLGKGKNGCPAAPKDPCKLYSPGLYTGGIAVNGETAVFSPGLYYMDGGGFGNSDGDMLMCSGCGNDAVTGAGMLVYLGDSGTVGLAAANSTVALQGSDLTSTYKGILFFGDRINAPLQTHSVGGGGNLTLTGKIYLTNGANMTATRFQKLALNGESGYQTVIKGDIIVDALSMGGDGPIKVNLEPTSAPVHPLHLRQVALIR